MADVAAPCWGGTCLASGRHDAGHLPAQRRIGSLPSSAENSLLYCFIQTDIVLGSIVNGPSFAASIAGRGTTFIAITAGP